MYAPPAGCGSVSCPPGRQKVRESKKIFRSLRSRNCPPTFKTVAPPLIETAGTWNAMAIELVHEIGRRITVITEDSRETTFFVAMPVGSSSTGNAVSFQNTMTTE